MLQTKDDRCKQKRCAANKNRSLQTKEMGCKQKTIAASKKDALQTKNDSCKQKRCAANKKRFPAKPKYLARLEIYKAFQNRLTILNRLIGEIY